MDPPVNGTILCAVDEDCLFNGQCANPNTTLALCNCYRGYSGEKCEIGIQNSQFPFFVVHLFVFIPLFAISMVVGLINAITASIMYKRRSGKVVDWTIILIFVLIVVGCLIRVLWLAIDPYWAYRIIPIRLENVFYGVGQWSIVAEAIIVVAAWSVVYNSFDANRQRWLQFVKPVCVVAVAVLLAASILQGAFRQSFPPSQRNTFGTVYSAFLLAAVLLISAGFLIYGRRIRESLRMFKGEPENARYMRKINNITTSVAIVAIVIGIVIAVASFARLFFRVPVNFLAWESLFRLIEAGVHLVILQTFSFHRYWKLACSPSTEARGGNVVVSSSSALSDTYSSS